MSGHLGLRVFRVRGIEGLRGVEGIPSPKVTKNADK